MRLIGLAVVLAFGLALVPVEAHAQQAGKVYRVGYLYEGSANAITHASLGTGLDALRQGSVTSGGPRARTSSSRPATPRTNPSGWLVSQMSSSV